MIEEGLNTEYPEIASILDRYTQDNDVVALEQALIHPQYQEYKAQLERLLLNSYGGKPIPVIRAIGYAGGTGEGAGKYVSVSTNPLWGKASGAEIEIGAVNPGNVMFAGNEAEGELIIRRGSKGEQQEGGHRAGPSAMAT
jgi:hypothetical protein